MYMDSHVLLFQLVETAGMSGPVLKSIWKDTKDFDF